MSTTAATPLKPPVPPTVTEIMAAANAVTAVAARVAHDAKLTAELVDAQHAGDVPKLHALLATTGVPLSVTLAEPVSHPANGEVERLRISGGITITHQNGSVSVSITLSVSK
jgi:hypothetical protein